MGTVRMCCLLGLAVVLLASAAGAASPQRVSYQGKLTDAVGVPQNGQVAMKLRIYDALTSGNLVWGPEAQTVTVYNGLFSVYLGAVTPLPPSVFAGSSTYLELEVQGQKWLCPLLLIRNQ